uniref:Uncharacterized protein n=1 Tax=Heterorhabditis bacteriophora TaxID=37862 RepID=A0A1I7WG68_HETBA
MHPVFLCHYHDYSQHRNCSETPDNEGEAKVKCSVFSSIKMI